MKKKIIFFLFFMLTHSLAYSSIARPAKEIFELIISKCRVCRNILSSPAAEKLVKNGTIKAENADEVAHFLSRHGDEGLKHLERFGDDALIVFTKYGDEGMAYLKRYGDDYLQLIKRESPETVNKILKHPDGMIFLKESPDLARHYTKYGDDLLVCLEKNPLCVETVKRTGLSPKIISKLKDTNVSWLEVKMQNLSPEDANKFRDILTKYGDPALDFIRKHWDIFSKTGVFVLAAANFDKILNGGRDVLLKTVETAGDVAKETGKTVAKETAKAAGDVAKEATRTMGKNYLFLFLLFSVVMFLTYRIFKTIINKKNKKTQA